MIPGTIAAPMEARRLCDRLKYAALPTAAATTSGGRAGLHISTADAGSSPPAAMGGDRRNLIVSSLVSLDGIHGDPQSWAGDYFGQQAAEESLAVLLDSDAMLMGRNTYQYFA